MEFHLYFKDGDEAHAAQKRVADYANEINTVDDVRSDLRDWCEPKGLDPVGVARELQQRLQTAHPVTVTWPASHDDYGWELILEAESASDVQRFVGTDLDYTLEAD